MMETIYRIEKKRILGKLEAAIFTIMALPFISIQFHNGQFNFSFVMPGSSSNILASLAELLELLVPFASIIPVITRKFTSVSFVIVLLGLSDLLYSLSFFLRTGTMSYFAWFALFDLVMLLIYLLTTVEFFNTNTVLFLFVIGITIAAGMLFIGYLASADFMNITSMIRTALTYLIIAAITIEMSSEEGHFQNNISHGEFMGIERINETN